VTALFSTVDVMWQCFSNCGLWVAVYKTLFISPKKDFKQTRKTC